MIERETFRQVRKAQQIDMLKLEPSAGEADWS